MVFEAVGSREGLSQSSPLQDNLLSQQRGRVFHPEPQVLHLVAWPLSGVPSEPEVLRERLPSLSRERRDSLLLLSMKDVSGNSVGGVVDGVWIPFLPLWQK